MLGDELGELDDRLDGTHRLSKPHVRARFVALGAKLECAECLVNELRRLCAVDRSNSQLVLRELQRKAEAVSALVRAVAIYPLLWAAWTEIAALVTEPEALSALSLPSHWMRSFFDAHAALEAQQNKQARARPRVRVWGCA